MLSLQIKQLCCLTKSSKTQLSKSIQFWFYVNAYADRDCTVGEGFFINNEHYDVHRFHPPLVYGRRGGPDEGEGIALCKFKPRTPVADEAY